MSEGECLSVPEEALWEVRSRSEKMFPAKCRNRADVQSECARVSESNRERQMSAISAKRNQNQNILR